MATGRRLRDCQSLRPDAVDLIDALRERGLDFRILSGDRAEAVAPVASALGIDNWQAALKPADKIAARRAQAQGRRVLMVGDGLNDAPALAAAHVSLSPISAATWRRRRPTPCSSATASSRCWTPSLSRSRARPLMTENLALAVIYNAFAVPIAIAGW